MSVMIGHARGDENRDIHGGQAGDQTGQEVCIQAWFPGGWNVVLRPKDWRVAEKMARFCEDVCKGNMVGYDQYQRNTLRDEARKAGWDGGRIANPCETDCSAFMTCCAEAAGIAVQYTVGANGYENAPVTGNMRQRFFQTGQFNVLSDRKYTDSSDYLRRGDVLLRESGHTAMALSDGTYEEDAMTGEEIYEKLNRYLQAMPAPDWAQEELREAVERGITDGENPMQLVPRYQAAIMVKRAVEKMETEERDEDVH